jgi:hypothetical protein
VPGAVCRPRLLQRGTPMAQRLLLSLFLILLTQPLLADSLVVPIGDSPALGAANAPVTIIEFIDFQ